MRNADRFANIDALRAIAALSVFWQHAAGDIYRAAGQGGGAIAQLATLSLGAIDIGRFGVVLFFLISGFVVPFSFKPGRPVIGFVVSRLFRLFPLFWLALGLVALLKLTLGQPFDAWTIAANATMMPHLFGVEWMSGIYWTLFIELLFYGAVAALFLLRSLRRPAIVLLVAIGLCSSTLVPILLSQGVDGALPVQYVGLHLSFLFSGLLLRLAIVEKADGAGLAAGLLAALQLLAVPVVALYSASSGGAFAAEGVAQTVLAYGAAIAVFLGSALFNRPGPGLLATLGVISYSIYLLHGPVCLAVYRILPLGGGWTDAIVIALCLMLTLLASSATYRWVEKPGMGLGRALFHRLRRQKQAISA